MLTWCKVFGSFLIWACSWCTHECVKLINYSIIHVHCVYYHLTGTIAEPDIETMSPICVNAQFHDWPQSDMARKVQPCECYNLLRRSCTLHHTAPLCTAVSRQPTPRIIAHHSMMLVIVLHELSSTSPSIHRVAAGRCRSRGRSPWPAGGALTANSWTAPASAPSAHTVPALSAGWIFRHPLLRTPPANQRLQMNTFSG